MRIHSKLVYALFTGCYATQIGSLRRFRINRLTLKDGTNRLSRNVVNYLRCVTSQRSENFTPRRKTDIGLDRLPDVSECTGVRTGIYFI